MSDILSDLRAIVDGPDRHLGHNAIRRKIRRAADEIDRLRAALAETAACLAGARDWIKGQLEREVLAGDTTMAEFLDGDAEGLARIDACLAKAKAMKEGGE